MNVPATDAGKALWRNILRHVVVSGPAAITVYDSDLTTAILAIEAEAAAAARAESEALREALIWCSGSPSFQPEGEAREGWVTICQPLLAARDGAPRT